MRERWGVGGGRGVVEYMEVPRMQVIYLRAQVSIILIHTCMHV